MKYVALDVHQATTVTSDRDEGGRALARSVHETHGPTIVEFFRGMRGAIHVAFEEGTPAQWLHDLLVPLVDRVVVCERRGRPRQGDKGDHVDADQLSELLRRGGLRSVHHGSAHCADLKEFIRTYRTLVEDGTRVMPRLKALFRACAIPIPGATVYHAGGRWQWLKQLTDCGARRDPAWPVLRAIPFLGPVRVAMLLATMGTPWRFRTTRNLLACAGLTVVTPSSADDVVVAGQPVRRRRPPLTRGLNRNHNRMLKGVFKGAATAATARPGPLQDFYQDLVARGMREELARVTLTREFAALTLRLRKKREPYDPTRLTRQAL